MVRVFARLMTVFSFVLFLPMVVLAQEPSPTPVQVVVGEPQSVDQILGLLPLLMEFLKSGQYLALGALIVLILVFLFRKYAMAKLKLKPGVLPVLSAILGVVAGSALALANGAPKEAALLALLSGPAASQMWDAIVKYMFKKPEQQ